jgi:hypothetical protein
VGISSHSISKLLGAHMGSHSNAKLQPRLEAGAAHE